MQHVKISIKILKAISLVPVGYFVSDTLWNQCSYC